MKATDYQKIITRIASKLKNKTLVQNEISSFIKESLGYSFKEHYSSFDNYEKKQAFKKEYQPLFLALLGMIESFNEINKYPTDFNVKHEAFKIVGLAKEIRKYKEDPNYEFVLLEVLSFVSLFRADLKLNEERVKVLYRRYID